MKNNSGFTILELVGAIFIVAIIVIIMIGVFHLFTGLVGVSASVMFVVIFTTIVGFFVGFFISQMTGRR